MTEVAFVTKNRPSLAINCKTLVPGVEKDATVTGFDEDEKLTLPGPLTRCHKLVRIPLGKPSSVTIPFNCAEFVSLIVWLEPAKTNGGELVGSTVMVAALDSACAPTLSVALA